MIVLDTNALFWWRTGNRRLSAPALDLIERTGIVGIPAICCVEIALLADEGRVRLDRGVADWLSDALRVPGVELLPITPRVAQASIGIRRLLGGGDPSDALIAAHALVEQAPLITRDMRLSNLKVIETIW